MKVSEFLTKILPASAFPDNDIAAALGASGLKEIDLPDTVEAKFNSYYMTKERAANDPEISRELKNKHFGHFADAMESDLKKIVGTLPQDYQDKYWAIPKDKQNGIYDRLKIVGEGVSHLATAGSGEDIKTATEKWRKTERELRDQLTEKETLFTKQAEEFAAKEGQITMNYALKSKLEGMIPKLDQNYFKTPAQKKFLVESTVKELQDGFKLEFDKDDQAVIHLRRKDGTDVYEGNNQKVTLEKYLEKAVEPYIVKNNGGAAPPAKPAPPQTPLNQNGATLRDKQWATGATV